MVSPRKRRELISPARGEKALASPFAHYSRMRVSEGSITDPYFSPSRSHEKCVIYIGGIRERETAKPFTFRGGECRAVSGHTHTRQTDRGQKGILD